MDDSKYFGLFLVFLGALAMYLEVRCTLLSSLDIIVTTPTAKAAS